MLKYVDTKVTFAEIPDEITLCINISNCPCHCKGCHSSYLAEDIGEPLYLENLYRLIDNNEGITCVAFMGGDSSPKELDMMAAHIKDLYYLKTAWYSGRQELSKDIDLKNFDFIKLGPYKEECGPLNSKTTNQRFYRVGKSDSIPAGKSNTVLIDETYKFWNNKESM